MNRKMKMIAAVVLITAVLSISLGYALLTAFYSFGNTLIIKGVGVDVTAYIGDNVEPVTKITAKDWGKLAANDAVYFLNLTLKNIGTEKLSLHFNTTLSPTIGVVTWQIEQSNPSGMNWTWQDWQARIDANDPAMLGTTTKPLQVGAVAGWRGDVAVNNVMGHIRILLTIANNAPFGVVPSFEISVYGTEA